MARALPEDDQTPIKAEDARLIMRAERKQGFVMGLAMGGAMGGGGAVALGVALDGRLFGAIMFAVVGVWFLMSLAASQKKKSEE